MSSPDVSIVLPNLAGGGAEAIALRLAGGFLAKGLKVEFVLLNATGELIEELPDGVTLVDLGRLRLREAFLPLLRYFRDRRPTSALVGLWPLTSLAVCAGFMSRSGVRIIVCEHSILSQAPAEGSFLRQLRMKAAMRLSHRWAHAVVAVSQGVADDLVSLTGLRREDINVIWNPITPLPPACLQPADGTEDWLSHDGPKLIAVGKLKPVKDYPTLLKAFAKVHRSVDARLLILGEGEERGALERQIASLNISGFVDLPGFVNQPHAFMEKADLFVLSSVAEGFGNVIVEALACGIPVVSTNCPGGPAEILENGQYGTLTPGGDVDSLAEAILGMLAAPQSPELLIRRSEEFSVERAVDQYLRLLNS